jgi:hypothetical protein
MKQYYGNYLGVVVTGGEKDPEGRGRVQVFVPHIMPTLYEGWNKEGKDITFNIIGEGLPEGLDPGIVSRLQRILPWAECAAPIIGASPSVKNGSEAVRNVGTAAVNSPSGEASGMPSRAGIITGTSGAAYGNLSNLPAGQGAYIQGKIGSPNNKVGHFDIKQVGLGYFDRNDLDQFVFVNNKPIGASPPVPKGGFYDKRDNGARTHSGYDYAFPNAGAPLTLANGAKWVSNGSMTFRNGERGDRATFQLPDGRQFEILHGKFDQNYQAGAPAGYNPSVIEQGSGINLQQDGSDAGFASLPNSIESKIDPDSKGALTSVATANGLDPNAIALLINTESGWSTSTRSPGRGTYRGLTQIGEQTFREAGGSLGGLTWQQFQSASPAQQINTYGAWLNHYNFGSKVNAAGINLSQLTTAQQAALLQGFQFAPNASGWLNAFGRGDGSVPATTTNQADRLGNTSINDMAAYYGDLYGSNELANIARSNVVVQNTTPYQMQSGPPTNNQARGMFGYASEGTTVWVFFREGDPHFPVYFAASYGQREWQNLYQYSSPGVGAGVGPGGAQPGTEVCDMRLYGGGQRSVQISEESGQEPDFIHQIYSTNGSNLTFMKDHTEFNSIYDHVNRVLGDHQDITESNREMRVRGDFNTYAEQDVYVNIGNWSDEAVAASDEIQQYINEAMEIKSNAGGSGGGSSSSAGSSSNNKVTLESARKATQAEIDRVTKTGVNLSKPTGRYAIIGTDGTLQGYTNNPPPGYTG